MPIAPGIIVVDATFLKDLKRPDSVARIKTAMRVAHLEIAPSVSNVFEAIKHPNKEIRGELLTALRGWARLRHLTPWPMDLIRHAGRALPNTDFTYDASELMQVVEDPNALEKDHERVVTYIERFEKTFADAFDDNRSAFQRTLKETGQKYTWTDIPAFLESADWSSEKNQSELVMTYWAAADLPQPPPSLDVVRRSELWRLALDLFGAATFARAIAPNKQANPPGLMDLMQLLYLTEHRRSRIFVTDDTALHDAATSLLRGRYPGTRVMTGGEFLELAA
jgi:hypothetical protein